MSRHVRRSLTILSLLFGTLLIDIDTFAESESKIKTSETSAQTLGDDLWVEVEPSNLLPSDITGIYLLIPYRNRRDSWGEVISLGMSSYAPINYEPDAVAGDFYDVYAHQDLPLIELQFTLKKNLALGSIGGEIGVGLYKNQSDTTLVNSTLELTPIRLGVNLHLDNLFFEPYVVPYGSAGLYTILYNESHDAITFKGNSQVAPYYTLGLEFQLNWLDREAARISYLDSGIENTFVYAELRQFFKSQEASDPNFSAGLNWGAGVRLEF